MVLMTSGLVAMKAFAGYLSLFLTGWLLSPSLSVNSTSEIILVSVSDTYFYVNYHHSQEARISCFPI